MEKILQWLVNSSANPEATSLTLKGILIANLPFIINLAHFTGSMATAQMIQNNIDVTCQTVATLLIVFGGIRKVYLTIFPKKVLELNVAPTDTGGAVQGQ